VTPVGDIEVEIVLRIAVRGRTRDLAELLNAVTKTEAVVMWVVDRPAEGPKDQDQKDLTTRAEGVSR
jgi:hypothetical protein